MNKKREIVKIVVGLTPVVGVTVAAAKPLVSHTFEHGWLALGCEDCLWGMARFIQSLSTLAAFVLFMIVLAAGIVEAVKAAKRLNGGT